MKYLLLLAITGCLAGCGEENVTELSCEDAKAHLWNVMSDPNTKHSTGGSSNRKSEIVALENRIQQVCS